MFSSSPVLASLSCSPDFPHNRATPLLILPAVAAIAGTIDTVRCMQPRWSFYHGGVLLCIYMDLMALCMILFFLLYPYAPLDRLLAIERASLESHTEPLEEPENRRSRPATFTASTPTTMI